MMGYASRAALAMAALPAGYVTMLLLDAWLAEQLAGAENLAALPEPETQPVTVPPSSAEAEKAWTDFVAGHGGR